MTRFSLLGPMFGLLVHRIMLVLLFVFAWLAHSLSVWADPSKDPLTLAAYFEAAQHSFNESQFKAIFADGRRSEQLNPGYAGAYRGLLARDDRSPISRLKNACTASSLLNKAVTLEGSDPRWRLLRLILEVEMPGWLGLSEHIQEDQTFLNRLLSLESIGGPGYSTNGTSNEWSKFYKKMKF